MLIERDEQLDDLTQMLAQRDQGNGALGLITGPVGSGKTALLHALCERASGDGFLVLSASGSADDRYRANGLLDQLWAPPGTGQHENLSEPSFCKMIASLAAAGKVLIAVDDAQYGDLASLRCLLYLVRRCRTIPVAVVLSCGPQRCASHPQLLGELRYEGTARHVPLRMLSPDGVVRLISGRLGDAASRRRAPAYMAKTGGNPALVRALLDDETAASGTVSMFRQTALTCINHCGPDGIRVARAIAILRRVPAVPLLCELTGLEERTVVRAVQSLSMAGILDGGRFRAGATRVAVLDELSADVTADLHYRGRTGPSRRGSGSGRDSPAPAGRGPGAGAVGRHLSVPGGQDGGG